MSLNTSKIKGLLKEKGFTYTSFVEEVGMSMTAFQNSLKKQKTDTDTFVKMCKVLDVEPNDLLIKK